MYLGFINQFALLSQPARVYRLQLRGKIKQETDWAWGSAK